MGCAQSSVIFALCQRGESKNERGKNKKNRREKKVSRERERERVAGKKLDSNMHPQNGNVSFMSFMLLLLFAGKKLPPPPTTTTTSQLYVARLLSNSCG